MTNSLGAYENILVLGIAVVLSPIVIIAFSSPVAYGLCTRPDPAHPGINLADQDCDGLADTWEINHGWDYDGDGLIDVPLPLSNQLHKDIYIEIDYSGYHNPQSGATTDVTNAFLPAPVWNPDGGLGVNVHYITGQDVQSLIGQETCLNGWTAFDNIKDQKLGTAAEQADTIRYPTIWNSRSIATHYVLSIDTQCADPSSSGISEIFGNDMIISLGGPGWGTDGSGHNVGSRAEQAGAIMHELGHNLNLRHGGNIDTNCKPNYISAMSYTFEFPTFVSGRILDFSRSTLNSLNENAGLNEVTGIIKANPTTARSAYGAPPVLVTQVLSSTNNPINWNRDADTSDLTATANINNLGITDCNFSTQSTLYGYTDWLGLIFWGSGANFANITLPGGSNVTLSNGSNVTMSNDTVANSGSVNSSANLGAVSNTTLANVTSNLTGVNNMVSLAENSSINSSLPGKLMVPVDPPPCDPQDPACSIVPCNPLSPTCVLTPCDPGDPNCRARPTGTPDTTGPEYTVGHLHESRIRALETIDGKFGSLPNSAFTNPNPSDVALQKASVHSKLLTDVDSVKSLAGANNREIDAISKMGMVKGLAIAALNSSPSKTDIIFLIDNLVNGLQLQK